MNTACVFTIGDEILLGQILDTNSRHIAKSLSDAGIDVVAKLTVGDERSEIEAGLTFAFEKVDIVLITGGLGPTKDDITKRVLADWFDCKIETNPEALANLEALLRRRGREMNALTRTQADQPTKSEYIHNKVGTAPGMWFAEKGKICICLPGVPYEMVQMLADEIIPRLKSRLKLEPILHRFVRTVGIAESTLAERIEGWENQLPTHLKLAYLPSGGQVKLRITGRGLLEDELDPLLDRELEGVMKLISDVVYSTEDVEIEDIVSDLLIEMNGNLVINDEISEGLLKSKLVRNEKMPARIIDQLPSQIKAGEHWFKIALIKSQSDDRFDQKIEIEHQYLLDGQNKTNTVLKPMKSFPHPQVNQNMISLWTLDLLRRMILESEG